LPKKNKWITCRLDIKVTLYLSPQTRSSHPNKGMTRLLWKRICALNGKKYLIRLRKPSFYIIFTAMCPVWFVQVKSHYIKISRYLKQVTSFTQWSKVDTVRAALLSSFLLLPMSTHFLCPNSVLIYVHSAISLPLRGLYWASTSTPERKTHSSRSPCRLHRVTHERYFKRLTSRWCGWYIAWDPGYSPEELVGDRRLIRHLIPTASALLPVTDVRARPLKRVLT